MGVMRVKAVLHSGVTGYAGLSYSDFQDVEPKAHEVKITLKASGLNHRDMFVLERHKADAPPLIIGSDGAGVVEAVGSQVTTINVGDEVVIHPGLGWQTKSAAPPDGFEILGLPDHGTFAETIVIDSSNVFPKPSHLSWEEAAVLSLAALTGYRALFSRGQLEEGQTVFLPGIGSGVATYMLQMAKAIGARVIVSSRHKDKQVRAVELGADVAIDSHGNWPDLLQDETIDLVVDSIGSATFTKDLSVLKKGGTMVVFGASSHDEVTFNLREFFYGQYSLLGTTMGSTEEYKDMLQFVEKYKLKSVVDSVYPLQEFMKAFKRMESAEQFGKIALKI